MYSHSNQTRCYSSKRIASTLCLHFQSYSQPRLILFYLLILESFTDIELLMSKGKITLVEFSSCQKTHYFIFPFFLDTSQSKYNYTWAVIKKICNKSTQIVYKIFAKDSNMGIPFTKYHHERIISNLKKFNRFKAKLLSSKLVSHGLRLLHQRIGMVF